MNEVLKTIKERRSIRDFKPDMPEKALVEQVVEAGLYAASAMGSQDTKILAVTNKQMRDMIAKVNSSIMSMGGDPFYGAPVILIVLGDKGSANRVYDGSLVMGNMMLAAESLGLANIWIHRAKEEFELPEFKDMLKKLGVSGEWEGIGHLALGYAGCPHPEAAPRKADRVIWVE